MKRTRKKIVIIIVVIVAVAAVAFVATTGVRSRKAAAQMDSMVSTATVAQEAIENRLSEKAALEGTESVEVVSQLHAEVLSIHVKEGDKVTKGQLLATLDSTDIQKELQLSQDAVELQQAQSAESLQEKQKAYEEAVTQRDQAQMAYDQAAALYAGGAGTAQAVQDAKDKLDAAQRTVDGYSVQNGKVVASTAEKKAISNAQAGVGVQADKLADCEIKSQIDGTVTRVYTKVGRFADDTEDKEPMFVIENIDSLQMKVMVSEYDIAKIQVGQTAMITADVLGDESVQGVVDRISPTGELKEGSTAERVVPVYIRITDSNPRLISGVTAKASILLDRVENALTVPYEAVASLPDGSNVVYLVNDDNTVKVVPVTLGLENDLKVQVLSDQLSGGERVILNPGTTLTDGSLVNPM